MFYLFFIGIAYFISISDQANISNKCYHAKICVHDAKEKCGQDENGKVRRFLDSCDMKEYNCLNEANFMKTSDAQCEDLPMDDKDQQKDNDPSVNESEDENKSGRPDGLSVEEEADEDKDKDILETKKLKGENKYEAYTKERNSDNESEDTVTKTQRTLESGRSAVINDYWCWRAKYCHTTGKIVCGRDRRLNKRQKFNSACDMYKHNCNEGHDFTVTNKKFCKGY